MRCWGKKWLREVEGVEEIAWGQGLLDPIFYAFTPLYNPNPCGRFPQ
jgi:hypothetical protein